MFLSLDKKCVFFILQLQGALCFVLRSCSETAGKEKTARFFNNRNDFQGNCDLH